MENDKRHAMRHTTAHILAAAAQRLYPGIKLGVGPVVENGFFYDILFASPITEEDLVKLEEEMHKIVAEDHDMVREEISIDQAIEKFREMGQDFKVELLRDLKEKGTTKVNPEEAQDIDVARPDVASLYRTGEFVDLCRGPHVGNVKEVGAFKLWKLAGAYWRGDEKNPQMQRIYGLVFEKQEELDQYLTMLEEAKKRDHRKLGKELELFTIIDDIGSGLPLFYPKGALLRRVVENFISNLQEPRGYTPIWIPHITKGKLYERSGHLQKYDAMYPLMHLEDEADYYLKPMNCPHFMMLYATTPHSYREMPMRWVCTTTNYRYEKSGELSGLTRVRSLTQDDCHVFARPDQIAGEINLMLDMVELTYKAFGFNDFWVRISVSDPDNPDKYIGDKQVWIDSEASLKSLIQTRGWKHEVGVGEAAFYGPKLDFMFKDAIGREWQLSTIQLDMNLPERFELEYVDSDGSKKRPVVIHRAILGSTERFLGILIEHYAGAFPFWIAPVQVRLATVSDEFVPFAKTLQAKLVEADIRVDLDDSNEKVGKKIRNSATHKIPWTIVIGQKEAEGGDFKVNVFGQEEDLIIPAPELVDQAKQASQSPQ
ncbi:threonine--tRNA ligase [Patescibacteria group bacterium]|nr:MAG: threonine--tRNA ligase [Patescibacteria group bacterium]